MGRHALGAHYSVNVSGECPYLSWTRSGLGRLKVDCDVANTVTNVRIRLYRLTSACAGFSDPTLC